MPHQLKFIVTNKKPHCISSHFAGWRNFRDEMQKWRRVFISANALRKIYFCPFCRRRVTFIRCEEVNNIHMCVWDNIYALDHESGIHVIIHVYAVRRLLWQPNEYFGMICHYCSCGFIFSLESFSFNFHSRYQKPKEIHSTKVIVIWKDNSLSLSAFLLPTKDLLRTSCIARLLVCAAPVVGKIFKNLSEKNNVSLYSLHPWNISLPLYNHSEFRFAHKASRLKTQKSIEAHLECDAPTTLFLYLFQHDHLSHETACDCVAAIFTGIELFGTTINRQSVNW